MLRLAIFLIAFGLGIGSSVLAVTDVRAHVQSLQATESEIDSPQKIRLRYGAAGPYSTLKEVEIKSPLIERVDQKTRLGGYTVVLVTLTNVDGYTCDTDKPILRTSEDFAIIVSLVELFDKKGPEKTFIHSMLYDNKVATGDVEFKRFNIGLHQLDGAKEKTYVKTDVSKGACKFLRSPEGTRLVIKYEDKNLSVDGDVDLTFCKIISHEEPKK
jgi:hypothetical protein